MLFDRAWSEALATAWNASGARHRLAELGPVCFVAEDESDKVCLDWDETGRVSIVHDAGWPTFTATRAKWLAFIDGQFKASTGLLRGDLRFDGHLVSIVRYSLAFNALAEVTRGLMSADIPPETRSGGS